ncbi:MAG: amino acid ABC transporter substrate-binding protein, partial [Gammaproteobacteria bacterium]
IFAPQAYDATMLMILSAIANGTDGGSIASGMIPASGGGTPCIGAACIELALAGEDFDYVGASGPIDLDANGDPTAGTYDIYQIQGDEYVVLETIDYPTKEE